MKEESDSAWPWSCGDVNEDTPSDVAVESVIGEKAEKAIPVMKFLQFIQ